MLVLEEYRLSNFANVNLDRNPDLGTPHFVRRRAGLLSPPAPDATPDEVVSAFLRANARAFMLHPSDIQPPKARAHQDYRTRHNGLRHLRWQQQKDGIDIYGATFALNLTRDNQIVNVSSRALHLDEVRFHRVENISKEQTVEVAAAHLATEQSSLLAAPEFSRPPVPIWYPLDMASAVLAWDLTGKARDSSVHRLIVRADTGQVVEDLNLTWNVENSTYHVFTNDSPTPYSPGMCAPTNYRPPVVDRTWVTLTALSTNASPQGWIPPGSNTTTGNNIDAYADWDDDDKPDAARPRPQGNPYRVFNPSLSFTNWAYNSNNLAAAVVQAFYFGNVFHDRLYDLGFDEAAGNFQENNFGRGGLGADSLHIEVQDGYSKDRYDNAYFTGFGDGGRGRIELRFFVGNTLLDSALDAEVVFHEAAHGVSTRLIGDGFGLSATQSRGMGEGWSDFLALSLLSESGDDLRGCYAFGAYVSAERGPANYYYFGSRRFPYSTDPQKAPQTLADTDPNQIAFPPGIPMNPEVRGAALAADQVHRIGEVWCLALWECRANLIQSDGFVGNQNMLQLVVDGMKLTPVTPNFAQARDAILQADLVNYGGTNQIALWRGFAKRGLGYSAQVPASDSTVGIVEAFDLPFGVEALVVERRGDGDGYVESGEEGELVIKLTSHEMGLTNVSAVLSTQNSNVTVTADSTVVGDLPAGQAGLSSPPFVFRVGLDSGGFVDVDFLVRVQSQQGWFEEAVRVRIGNPHDYPPEITGITVTSVTESNVWISWRTGIATTGRVEYGLTTNYGLSISLEGAFRTNHLVELPGLSKGAVYHYRIVSLANNGLVAESEDRTFRTPPIYVSVRSAATEEWGTVEAPFKTLPATAETARLTGSEIWLAEGTYTGTNSEAVLFLNGAAWNLKVQGGYSPDFSERDPRRFLTVIDGQRQRRGIRLDNGAALDLSGVTITRGGRKSGGGIHVRQSTLKAESCVITDNDSTTGEGWYGGGVYATLGSVVTLSHCAIVGNRAVVGGGISAQSDSTTIQAIDVVISRNSSDYVGGGVSLSLGAEAEFTRAFIYENSSHQSGGGVNINSGSSAALIQTTLTRNRVLLPFRNPEFAKGGGGVHLAASSDMTRLIVKNTILTGNEAESGADVKVGSSLSTYSEFHVSHSVIGDVFQLYWPWTTSNQVIRADPMFANPAAGDFHLLYGSPCIDAGDPAYATGDPDFDGEPRPFGAAPDIGADEFTDTDADRMADYWERKCFGNLTASDGTTDSDGDGLDDFEEYLNQTNPLQTDTDGDLAEDGWEVANGYDPLNPDMDGDGMLDGWEARHGLNAFVNDAALDADADGMSNLAEFTADTDPQDSNSLLRVLFVGRQGCGLRLEWQGGRDAWHFVEVNDDFPDEDGWIGLYSYRPPNPLTNSVIHCGSTNRTSFYRIRAAR